MRRLANDDGAVLILVMIIVTVMATLTVTLANFSFTTIKAADAQTALNQLEYALDSGMQAALENTRLDDENPADYSLPPCAGGSNLVVADAGGTGSDTSTTAAFTQPASGANVTVSVGSSTGMTAGQVTYVASAGAGAGDHGGGFYTVSSVIDATHVSLTNLGYAYNAPPTTTVASGSAVGPGGSDSVTVSCAGAPTPVTLQAVGCPNSDLSSLGVCNPSDTELPMLTTTATLTQIAPGFWGASITSWALNPVPGSGGT